MPGMGEFYERMRAQKAAEAERMRAVQARGPARETPPTWGGPAPEPASWRKLDDPAVDPTGFYVGPPDHRKWSPTERDGGLRRMVQKLYPTMQPPSPSRLGHLSKPRATLPTKPNLTDPRLGVDFPVHQMRPTVTKYEPTEYTLNKPLELCPKDPSHGYVEGVCGQCIAQEAKEMGQPGKTWGCGHAKTPENTASGGVRRPGGRCYLCRYGHPRRVE